METLSPSQSRARVASPVAAKTARAHSPAPTQGNAGKEVAPSHWSRASVRVPQNVARKNDPETSLADFVDVVKNGYLPETQLLMETSLADFVNVAESGMTPSSSEETLAPPQETSGTKTRGSRTSEETLMPEETSGMTRPQTVVDSPHEAGEAKASEASVTEAAENKSSPDVPRMTATRTAVFVPTKEESQASKMTRMRTAQVSDTNDSPDTKNPKAMLEQDYEDDKTGRAELVRNLLIGGITVGVLALVLVRLMKK